MGREEMVRLAKQSGVWDEVGFPKSVIKLIELAVAHEREECAKECDIQSAWGNDDERFGARQCGLAIRSRGEVVEVA